MLSTLLMRRTAIHWSDRFAPLSNVHMWSLRAIGRIMPMNANIDGRPVDHSINWWVCLLLSVDGTHLRFISFATGRSSMFERCSFRSVHAWIFYVWIEWRERERKRTCEWEKDRINIGSSVLFVVNLIICCKCVDRTALAKSIYELVGREYEPAKRKRTSNTRETLRMRQSRKIIIKWILQKYTYEP